MTSGRSTVATMVLSALVFGAVGFAQSRARISGGSSGVSTATAPIVVTGADISCTAASASSGGCLTKSGGVLATDAGFNALTLRATTSITSEGGVVATASGTTIGNGSCGIAFVPNATTISGSGSITLHGPVTADNAVNKGAITLSGGTGTASIVAGSTCVCGTRTANAVRCSISSTTLTCTGTNTDVCDYLCF